MFGSKCRALSGFFDQASQPVLAALERGEFCNELILFFREVHGAEILLIHRFGWFHIFRRARRFFVPLHILLRFMPCMAVFLVALTVFPMAAMLVLMTRIARLLLWLMARRLDAPQGAAKFFDFALIGELLAFGNLDQFKDFIQLINRVLQRFGNFCGVRDSLADGRLLGRAKIRGLGPLPLFRTTMFPMRLLFVAVFALGWRRGRRWNLSGRLGNVGPGLRSRNFFHGGGFSGLFRMRFAKAT